MFDEHDREQIISLAQDIIENHTDLVEGSIRLGQMIRRIPDYGKFDEYNLFDFIECEYDTTPIGNNKKNYSADYLRTSYNKAKEYIEPHKELIIKSCKKIIKNLKKI